MLDNSLDITTDGFSLYKSRDQWGNRSDQQTFELLLPTKLKSALDLEKKQLADERLAAEKAQA